MTDRPRLLGAILAGGQSRRFGRDKALEPVGGVRLIDRVASALEGQTDSLVVCGRRIEPFATLTDRPEAGLGPLGGLNAALHHAAANGFDAVLSSGCDVPNLPTDMARALDGEGAAVVESQPVIGLWPATLAGELDRFLAEGGRALYGFADRVIARRVAFDPPIGNVNRPDDLA